MNDTIRLLREHRSIRRFNEQEIAPDLLQQIIAAGQSASTSSFCQSVSVIRVTDKRKRQDIAGWAGGQPYVESAAEFLVFCADLCRANTLIEQLEPDSTPDPERFSWTEQFITASLDVGLFAQNCAIAAQSLGLGICYIGGVRNRIQDVSDSLGLPDLVVPLFGMCLGYPDQAPDKKPRLPSEAIFFENTYRTPTDCLPVLSEYDAHVKRYYEHRTGGKLSQTWSEQLKKQAIAQTRPHMQEFLNKKGFALR